MLQVIIPLLMFVEAEVKREQEPGNKSSQVGKVSGSAFGQIPLMINSIIKIV
jgi:hypothetical protein